MTLILMGATFALLTCLGVSCRRARLDLEDQICECLRNPVAAAVGYGGGGVELAPATPTLTGLPGGRQGGGVPPATRRRRHLQVVEVG